MLGFEGDDLAISERLIDEIRALSKTFGIEKNLKDFRVKEDEFLEKLPQIAKDAVGDACTGFNPREIDNENMEKVIKAIYYGEDIDF